MRVVIPLPRLFALLLFSLLPLGSAFADDEVYDFEIVIFERPGTAGDELTLDADGAPDPSAAVGRLDRLAVDRRTLGPVAYTLKKKGMIVHEHLAWRQVPGERNSKDWYWIGGGRLGGLIRVTRGRYLHLETDLLLRDTNLAEPQRIKLYRRMRSGELHYVDHPRLGILIQAERYEPTVSRDTVEQAPGEPKPVQPGIAPG